MTNPPAYGALWLLVPVKPFAESKSRLSPPLDGTARAALSRNLLHRLLRCAHEAALFDGIFVVSRDAEVRACAAQWGAMPLVEEEPDLNAALEQARRAACALGAQAVLVLPADLPLVTAAALQTLVAGAPAAPGIVLAPSSTGGTNALLVQPADALPFAYGADSCARHTALAYARGLEVVIHHAPALAFDVDVPDDLKRLAALRPST